jgi:hypothetical protein
MLRDSRKVVLGSRRRSTIIMPSSRAPHDAAE